MNKLSGSTSHIQQNFFPILIGDITRKADPLTIRLVKKRTELSVFPKIWAGVGLPVARGVLSQMYQVTTNGH